MLHLGAPDLVFTECRVSISSCSSAIICFSPSYLSSVSKIGALLINQADGSNKVWGLGLGFAQVGAFKVISGD